MERAPREHSERPQLQGVCTNRKTPAWRTEGSREMPAPLSRFGKTRFSRMRESPRLGRFRTQIPSSPAVY